MKKILLTLLLAALTLPPAAQFPMEKFPNYKDFSIPKPNRDTRSTRDDLRLTDKFLPLYPEGLPIASQQHLYKLYAFFRDTPEGQAEWREMQDLAVRVISTWNIQHPDGFGAARYIKSLLSRTPLSRLRIAPAVCGSISGSSASMRPPPSGEMSLPLESTRNA